MCVNVLKQQEQELINNISRYHGDQLFIVIHNCKDVDNYDDAQEFIQYNIWNNFDVKLIKENYSGQIVYRYLENTYEKDVYSNINLVNPVEHLIYLNDNSEAGNFYNGGVITHIRNRIHKYYSKNPKEDLFTSICTEFSSKLQKLMQQSIYKKKLNPKFEFNFQNNEFGIENNYWQQGNSLSADKLQEVVLSHSGISIKSFKFFLIIIIINSESITPNFNMKQKDKEIEYNNEKISCKKFIFKIEVPFIPKILLMLKEQKNAFLKVIESHQFTSSVFILDFQVKREQNFRHLRNEIRYDNTIQFGVIALQRIISNDVIINQDIISMKYEKGILKVVVYDEEYIKMLRLKKIQLKENKENQWTLLNKCS